MGIRYGLLAALTLVMACVLFWDRLHPPADARLLSREEPAREDVAVVVVGGRPVPLPPAPSPTASLPGVVVSAEPTAEVVADATKEGVYVVESGDSLGLISQKTLGTARKAAEIARFNGMAVDAPLKVGQELKIPPAAAPVAPQVQAQVPAPATVPAKPAVEGKRTHTVARGDSLFALSKRYYGEGSGFRAIAEANGLDADSPLKVGSEIRIP